MHLWHLTSDARRTPLRVSPGDHVTLEIGTWPVEPGQSVWVTFSITAPEPATGATTPIAPPSAATGRADAVWRHNAGSNSYWQAELGPFDAGVVVHYQVHGRSPAGEVAGPTGAFTVGSKLHLALVWHQHQPLFRDLAHPSPRGSYTQPWVRLHAIRDYYAMAALVAQHPAVHLTINVTPVLLWQREDYVERGATDRTLELTCTPAEQLRAEEREELLSTFFEAHWHNQILVHPRYAELFAKRQAGEPFDSGELRDLQMWFNLAWFGKEFRGGDVRLATGETASVHRFVVQQRDFSAVDVEAMVAEQYKILRAIIPIHRQLQDEGQVELATTPFYHPILPLLDDSDTVTIDRPGAVHPPRFAHPEDSDAHVRLAVTHYEHCFGRPPGGMWPAEGAVSERVVERAAEHGLAWLATDAGVLARSGRWGYRTDDPDVLCQPYRAERSAERTVAGAREAAGHLSGTSLFFRDAGLADRIGFHYQHYADCEDAAGDFLTQIRERFAERLANGGDRVLTVVLDGENAWSAYREDGRPFLHALYGRLAVDDEILTVTPAEYLAGNPARGVRPHPREAHATVHDLFTGSWIDEVGSAPGVDLGTWAGEAEENRGWALLGRVRQHLEQREQLGVTPASAATAFASLYAAEGSDWFWWLGEDQESGNDAAMDDLFRTHLANVYRALGEPPPAWLDEHLVPRSVTWTITRPVDLIQAGDRLVVRTNCPGELTWRAGNTAAQTVASSAVGGVMAGAQRFQVTLGPFDLAEGGEVRFRFRCSEPTCDGRASCCRWDERVVHVLAPASA